MVDLLQRIKDALTRGDRSEAKRLATQLPEGERISQSVIDIMRNIEDSPVEQIQFTPEDFGE